MTWTTTASTPSFRPAAAARRSEPVRAAQPTAGPHLTRRGRAALLLVLVGLLLGAFSLGRVGSQASTDRSVRPSYQQTTVHAGESLWSVARRVAPSSDPRAVVVQLRRLNHLEGAGVRVGQQLVLPRAA